jgi:hypothetical protein
MVAAKKETRKPKFPKSMGVCADMLYQLRENRLVVQKQVDAMEEEEKALREYIIQNLPKSQQSGAAGKVALAKIEVKPEPVVNDWDAFYGYIKKKGEFELLNRALNRKAVKERWDNGKTVPGVGRFNVTKVSVTKISKK